ncbi:unnamed protein product [Calicophoron daubneyi]|uniref:Uncharacterized protein n=1 Tax=Calicophoron daubneyi TaxID=300641 RepID=A0AAV2TSM5_CALDB
MSVSKTGSLPLEQLGNALRYLKLIPTEAEIAELKRQFVEKLGGVISLKIFTQVVASLSFSDSLESRTWAAFTTFDKELKGNIPSSTLKYILTELGREPIPEAEADKLINKYQNPKQMIEYSFLIKELLK